MLMVYSIELMSHHQLEEMLNFESCYSVLVEQHSNAGNEIIDIRYVCKHVVGRDQIGFPALGNELLCIRFAKELYTGIDASFSTGQRYTFAWFDTQTRNPLCNRILQQITIVRRNFDVPRVRIQAKSRNHFLNV